MKLPKLPRIRLQDLEELHEDTLKLFYKYEGQPLTGELCQRLSLNLDYSIDADIPRTHISNTLLQYEGQTLNQAWCDILARQIIARLDELRHGVLSLYEYPTRDEWVPLEIFTMDKCAWRETDAGIDMRMYCLAASPAGHVLNRKVPESWLSWLAYQVGFTRRIQYDYDPQQFVGFRLWGYLKADSEGAGAELDFAEWEVDRKMMEHNKLIILKRNRLEFSPGSASYARIAVKCSCPFDYYHYCSDCSKGVTDCVASVTRDRTYGQGQTADREPGGSG